MNPVHRQRHGVFNERDRPVPHRAGPWPAWPGCPGWACEHRPLGDRAGCARRDLPDPAGTPVSARPGHREVPGCACGSIRAGPRPEQQTRIIALLARRKPGEKMSSDARAQTPAAGRRGDREAVPPAGPPALLVVLAVADRRPYRLSSPTRAVEGSEQPLPVARRLARNAGR